MPALHIEHSITDLDSGAFAQHWGGVARTFNGVVVNLRADERSDVDRLYELALSLGGRSCKSPYDAFWGERYAVVEGSRPHRDRHHERA